MKCTRCSTEIEADQIYHHFSGSVCEDCCLVLRSSRSRKTHWQYLRSIKSDYLRSARGCSSLPERYSKEITLDRDF